MVSNCANPACATPLRYLRDGRLFQFEVKALRGSEDEGVQTKRRPARQVWHYWLCGRCSARVTLQFDGRQGLQVVPIPPASTGQYPHPQQISQMAS